MFKVRKNNIIWQNEIIFVKSNGWMIDINVVKNV